MEKILSSTENISVETSKSMSEAKQQQWQKKLDEIQTPDVYGYVIDKGIQETIVALQLLGFNTTQSDQGNYSETPWIQVEPKKPNDIYVGEQELKANLMTKAGISPQEIDETSPTFNREKQVDIEEDAREKLMKTDAAYTPEYQEWHKKSGELAHKLQNLVTEFYATRKIPEDSAGLHVSVEFSYHAPQYNAYIQDTPFLKVNFSGEGIDVDALSEEDRQLASTRSLQEMRRFTEFLKQRYFEKG